MATLRLDDIHMRYGRTQVLRGIDLEVGEGEFLVLVGPSGCGKSTLLRIVAGLAQASSGDVLLDGESVKQKSPAERDVAMVFQNYALYPHMKVAANIGFPLKMKGRKPADVRQRVAEMAATLGLSDLLDRRPGELSGGQMQRVALGRALIRDPRLFLFDEPLSNLDAQLRGEMRREIAALHRRLGITTLYVTHDQAEAMTMGSRVAVMREGVLEQVGPPLELFRRPATAFVASFIGSPPMNMLRGRARGGRFIAGSIDLAAPIAEGELTLGLRPHELAAGSGLAAPGLAASGLAASGLAASDLAASDLAASDLAASDLAASILSAERLGTTTHVELDCGAEQPLRLSLPGDSPLEPGTLLPISVPESACHWFAADGRRL